jgi:hypothetical protein
MLVKIEISYIRISKREASVGHQMLVKFLYHSSSYIISFDQIKSLSRLHANATRYEYNRLMKQSVVKSYDKGKNTLFHSITTKAKSPRLRLSVPLPTKLELTPSLLRYKFIIDHIFLITKVPKESARTFTTKRLRFNNRICRLIDLLVRILLCIMNFFHTTTFFNQVCIIIYPRLRSRSIYFADFKDILQCI